MLSGYLAEGLRRADAQLQQASNQLADLQAFSEHVIDSLASGLATTDIDGRIITFNRAAEAITGIAAGERRRAVDRAGAAVAGRAHARCSVRSDGPRRAAARRVRADAARRPRASSSG